MNQTAHQTAQCSCGALQATVQGAPEAVVACHCTDCQRRTGSVLGVGAYYPKERVTITGESKAFVRDTASGGQFRQNFCTTCGTTLFWTVVSKPGVLGIAVGGFADPDFLPPQRSVWEQTHHSWLGLPEEIPHFTRGRVAT